MIAKCAKCGIEYSEYRWIDKYFGWQLDSTGDRYKPREVCKGCSMNVFGVLYRYQRKGE